jgi:cation transport ATPase
LVGIHVGLTKVGGDGEGVLISTFLQMVPPEVEEVLGSSTPDILSSSSSENEGVELQLPSKEEKVSMEDENEIGVELPEQLDKERRKREEIEQRVQELEVERNKQKNLERQLEKEKRQREKAERREQELEAERQREQTKIQREQCKQRRSQKENQKKSELELEQKENVSKKRSVEFSLGLVILLILLIPFAIFTAVIWESAIATRSAITIKHLAWWGLWLGGLACVGFILGVCMVAIDSIVDFWQAKGTYHMWINCYDAYPPTPPRLF